MAQECSRPSSQLSKYDWSPGKAGAVRAVLQLFLQECKTNKRSAGGGLLLPGGAGDGYKQEGVRGAGRLMSAERLQADSSWSAFRSTGTVLPDVEVSCLFGSRCTRQRQYGAPKAGMVRLFVSPAQERTIQSASLRFR